MVRVVVVSHYLLSIPITPLHIVIFVFSDSSIMTITLSDDGVIVVYFVVYIVVYVLWQCAYLFKTEVLSKSLLEEHEDIETSLRWLARAEKNSFNKLTRETCYKLGVMEEGEKFDSRTFKTKAIFVTANFVYFCVCSITLI